LLTATCFCWKQPLHSTGLPCVGLKGTVVSTPHSEQCVRVSGRSGRVACTAAPSIDVDGRRRFALHLLHRLGSFLNCLSKKNSCSPAVKMNSSPQSAHIRTLSRNSIAATPKPYLGNAKVPLRRQRCEYIPKGTSDTADASGPVRTKLSFRDQSIKVKINKKDWGNQ